MLNETLRKAQKGDPAAMNELLETHKHIAYTIALKYVRDKEDAADIVQEAFVKVFLYIRSFKNEAKFSTWLFKIVYHESIKFIQLKKQHLSFDETHSPAHNEEKPTDERIENVKLAMRSLSEKEYTIINLFYLGDKSIKEIAAIVKISTANVKVILHRARKSLSNYLINKVKKQNGE